MAAVVFDWDGTLVDSQNAYIESWRISLEKCGHILNEANASYLMGRTFPDCLAFFKERIVLPDDFAALWRDDFQKRLAAEIRCYPDAVECAYYLRQQGTPLAIATQTPRAEFERALDATGLRAIADITVCRNEVARPKPAPDLYLEACRQLGVLPELCLAIEDSPVGAAAAHSAGLHVIGIARTALVKEVFVKTSNLTPVDVLNPKIFHNFSFLPC